MSNLKRTGANITIYKNGESKTIPATDLTITRAKSEAVKWNLSIFDPEGTYNPDNTESEWYEWLKPELQPVGAPDKFVNIEVFTGKASRTYTDLIILSRSYDATPEGYILNVSGADFSQLLFRDNQTKQTVHNSTAKAIIQTILSSFGFTSWELDFPDFPVTQFDFQADRPINRIQTLLNEVGGFWRCEGKRFLCWIPSVRESSDWNYRDSESLYFLRMSENVMDLVNKVTVCRVTKNADLAFSNEGTDEGRMNGSLSGVFWCPNFSVIQDIGCEVENVDYFYQGHHAGHGFTFVGLADEVYYTVTPTVAEQAPYWSVEVRGTPQEYLETGVDMDATYTYEDEASVAAYGELPAPNIESNFTATNTTAQLKAEAFMREQGTLKREIEFGAPINPYLELDETIFVSEQVSRYSGYFNVDSVTTTIRGSEGEDSIQVVEYE